MIAIGTILLLLIAWGFVALLFTEHTLAEDCEEKDIWG